MSLITPAKGGTMPKKIVEKLNDQYEGNECETWKSLCIRLEDNMVNALQMALISEDLVESKSHEQRVAKLQDIVTLARDRVTLKILIEFIYAHFGRKPRGAIRKVLSNAISKEKSIKEDMEVSNYNQ